MTAPSLTAEAPSRRLQADVLTDSDRRRVLEVVRRPHVLTRLAQPVRLASGEMSRDFIDGKLAVAEPADLEFVGGLMAEAARRSGVEFDAVGGLVLGAAPFTFAVARHASCPWFLVRKEPKGRGTNLWVEGARLTRDMRVMLVDDVVTTGGSIRDAYDRTTSEGAEVVFATTLVDRGDLAAAHFAGEGVPYVPLLTYVDLRIERVGPGSEAAPPPG